MNALSSQTKERLVLFQKKSGNVELATQFCLLTNCQITSFWCQKRSARSMERENEFGLYL